MKEWTNMETTVLEYYILGDCLGATVGIYSSIPHEVVSQNKGIPT